MMISMEAHGNSSCCTFLIEWQENGTEGYQELIFQNPKYYTYYILSHFEKKFQMLEFTSNLNQSAVFCRIYNTVMVGISSTLINKCMYINTIFRGHISIAPLANQLRSNKNPHASTLG